MKRNILILLLVAITTLSFGQVPKHLRVLNYVPDSCYSVAVVNLDTLARVFELEAMHRENFLKPIYDSMKLSKKLVQSWIKKDNKLGIDFTASAAYADSRYIFFPLNNEKNFEKTIRSLDKKVPPFETMTDPDGRKFRCLLIDDADLSTAVICTEDVACLALLTDPYALFSSPVFQSTISDTSDLEVMYEALNQANKETPMQLWTRISHSKFVESQTAATMISKGWNSYTAYQQGNSLINTMVSMAQLYLPAPEDIKRAVSELDIELFSKVEAYHDRLTTKSEFHYRAKQKEGNKLKFVPDALKRLMPYVSGDYVILAVSAMEGYGDLVKPYMNSFPQWRELCPLLNKPFVFTISMSETGYQIQAVTFVENPGEIHGALERYVEISNHITDSTYKARKKLETAEIEEVVEEPEVVNEEVVEQPVVPEVEEPMDYPLIEQEDSTINMKTLTFKKIGGLDAYIVVTNKREMDYETFTWIVKDDSMCVLVKDGLLFVTNSLASSGTLLQPVEREWPKEYLEHNLFARIDLGAFATFLGPEAALPVRDADFYVDGNTFTMNINAEPGLRHGVLYEILKYAKNLIGDLVR